MNSIGNNEWRHNGPAGVVEHEPGDPQDPFAAYATLEDDEHGKTGAEEQRPGRKRKRLIGAAIFFLIMTAAVAGLWVMLSGGPRTKVNVPVRDTVRGTAQKTDQTARGGDDATAQAIAEVRSATVTPSPAASASPAPGGTRTAPAPILPVTIPRERVGGAVSESASEVATEQQGGASRTQAGAAARPMGIVSERNPERSIRCALTPVAASTRRPSQEASLKQAPETESPVLKRTGAGNVALPTFGAMLPIRTMGALYTLRPGLARFELMRDVRGQGWQMRKGTTLIGQQQGGEYDR